MREVNDPKGQLRSSEALAADLQKTLQQRDSELMSKVSLVFMSYCNKEIL